MVAAKIARLPENARCVSSHDFAKPFTVCEITSVRESLERMRGNYESIQVSSYWESLVGDLDGTG